MNEKRIRKLAPLKSRRDLFMVEGEVDAPIALISWGSVAGVAMEALLMAQAIGIKAKLAKQPCTMPTQDLTSQV
jgi:2-oxoglutarate ferredoxin oxidoreductase subunit alpha